MWLLAASIVLLIIVPHAQAKETYYKYMLDTCPGSIDREIWIEQASHTPHSLQNCATLCDAEELCEFIAMTGCVSPPEECSEDCCGNCYLAIDRGVFNHIFKNRNCVETEFLSHSAVSDIREKKYPTQNMNDVTVELGVDNTHDRSLSTYQFIPEDMRVYQKIIGGSYHQCLYGLYEDYIEGDEPLDEKKHCPLL